MSGACASNSEGQREEEAWKQVRYSAVPLSEIVGQLHDVHSKLSTTALNQILSSSL